MRKMWIILGAVACGSCVAPYRDREWKEQPLIFPAPAVMSSGFAAVQDDGRTVTLTAELGQAQPGGAAESGPLEIERLSSTGVITEGRHDIRVGPLAITTAGTQVYTAFSARAEKVGRVSVGVYRDGRLIEGLLKVLEPEPDWKRYRFTLRVLEPVDGLTLRIQTDAAVEIEEFGALCKTPADNDTETDTTTENGPGAGTDNQDTHDTATTD